MAINTWDTFWVDQKKSFHEVMKLSTSFFASRLQSVIGVKAGDEVLDYGCGPGFLADCLKGKAIFTGVDINRSFIDECKNKHPLSSFVCITADPSKNTQLLMDHLNGKKFDLIILLSISQYLKNIEALERVVHMLVLFLKESGKIIVADVIDAHTSSVRDALALLFHCVKKGKLRYFVRFICYLLFSNYRTVTKHARLLEVPEQAMMDIAHKNALHLVKINRLTLHPTRSNYVLTKKSNPPR